MSLKERPLINAVEIVALDTTPGGPGGLQEVPGDGSADGARVLKRRFVRTWEAFNVADLIDSIFPSLPCLFISIADKSHALTTPRCHNLTLSHCPRFHIPC